MMRKDHGIILTQEEKWATIILMDREEKPDGSFVSGTWKSDYSRETGAWGTYSNKEVVFTSVNPKHYYWEWNGPHAGHISIGVKMDRASHKEGEDKEFQILLTLYNARRLAAGKFEPTSIIRMKQLSPNIEAPRLGGGNLTYNVSPDFTAGSILWNMQDYMGGA